VTGAKQIVMKPNAKLDKLTVCPQLSSTVVESWLKSIYSGIPRGMSSLVDKYGEIISIDRVFQRQMDEIAFQSNEGLFTDISFVTLESKTLKAHRILLNESSGFFQAMFESGLEGNLGSMLQIPVQFSYEDLLVITKFMSGIPLTFTYKNALHFYEIANRNLIDTLQIQAEDFIRKSLLGSEKAFDPFELLIFAIKMNCKSLEEFCVWYLQVNFENFKEKKEKWESLPGDKKDLIFQKQWPGNRYLQVHAEWERKKEELAGGRKKENCVLQ